MHDHPHPAALETSSDGVDRRGFLHCMAWAGAGVVWAMHGGILRSARVGAGTGVALGATSALDNADFTFVQISDSHIGFHKEPNQDVVGTLGIAIDRINALPVRPDLMIHTGDLTHGATPAEFDTVAESLKRVRVDRTLYVPGEHDITPDGGPRQYLERYGRSASGDGWSSSIHKGVRFIGLVNVVGHGEAKGLGTLGPEQLAWLEKDLKGVSADTPIVVYAHVPLWTAYEKWGWGTRDAEAALTLLKRFGSVTVLNGHVHQVLQKVEGKVMFHTARSTAFPQPEPGKADKPGPIKDIPAGKLKSMLGLAEVKYVERPGSLAIVDSSLDSTGGGVDAVPGDGAGKPAEPIPQR